MAWYPRLGIDRSLTSKIVVKSPIPKPVGTINHPNPNCSSHFPFSSISRSDYVSKQYGNSRFYAYHSPLSAELAFQFVFDQNHPTRGRRHYYAAAISALVPIQRRINRTPVSSSSSGFDFGLLCKQNHYCYGLSLVQRRYFNFGHLAARVFIWTKENLLHCIRTFRLLVHLVEYTVRCGKLVTIPYVKRTRVILTSRADEKELEDLLFEEKKVEYEGKMLPENHPYSVRIRFIAKQIIEALQRDWKIKLVFSGLDNAKIAKVECGKEDEFLDDKQLDQSRKLREGESIDHLEGLRWEVLMVDDPDENGAFTTMGGKIFVFVGLLKHFGTDAEIATIIGHEVGHHVARHLSEELVKYLWFSIIELPLHVLTGPDGVEALSDVFFRNPCKRRMEVEADYIGMLLIASAGYDPRVAPEVWRKFDELPGQSQVIRCSCTHPSGKKRAELLTRGKVMKEAMSKYREARKIKKKEKEDDNKRKEQS